MPPGPVKISHKKMAAKSGHIDFMFLGPPLPGHWICYCGSCTVCGGGEVQGSSALEQTDRHDGKHYRPTISLAGFKIHL